MVKLVFQVSFFMDTTSLAYTMVIECCVSNVAEYRICITYRRVPKFIRESWVKGPISIKYCYARTLIVMKEGPQKYWNFKLRLLNILPNRFSKWWSPWKRQCQRQSRKWQLLEKNRKWSFAWFVPPNWRNWAPRKVNVNLWW